MNKLITIAILFFLFSNVINSQTVVNLKKNKSEKIITKSGKNKYIDENGNIYCKKKKRKKKNRVVVKKPIRKKAKINNPKYKKRGYVWVGGHWKWSPFYQQYVWISAKWKKKKIGYKWQKGYWKSMPAGFLWVDGCWVSMTY